MVQRKDNIREKRLFSLGFRFFCVPSVSLWLIYALQANINHRDTERRHTAMSPRQQFWLQFCRAVSSAGHFF